MTTEIPKEMLDALESIVSAPAPDVDIETGKIVDKEETPPAAKKPVEAATAKKKENPNTDDDFTPGVYGEFEEGEGKAKEPAADDNINLEDDPDLVAVVENAGKETNIKKLREIITTLTKQKAKIKEVLPSKIRKEVEDEIKALKDEAEANKKYRAMFDFQNTPEAQEKFIIPAREIGGQIRKLFSDYNMKPEEAIPQMMQAASQGRKAFDDFLDDTFENQDARAELRSLFNRATTIQAEFQAAIAEPQQSLQKIIEEAGTSHIKKKKEFDENQTKAANNGWKFALEKNRTVKNALRELTEDPLDETHNKRTVEPLLKDAENAYQRVVKLAGKGEPLTDSEATYLGTLCQLATASHTIAASRNFYVNEVKKLKKQIQEMEEVERPATQFRAGNGAISAQGSAGEDMSMDTLAAHLFSEAVKESGVG